MTCYKHLPHLQGLKRFYLLDKRAWPDWVRECWGEQEQIPGLHRAFQLSLPAYLWCCCCHCCFQLFFPSFLSILHTQSPFVCLLVKCLWLHWESSRIHCHRMNPAKKSVYFYYLMESQLAICTILMSLRWAHWLVLYFSKTFGFCSAQDKNMNKFF